MIQSFRDADTEALFRERRVRRFQLFEGTALRKLIHLNRATSLRDLSAIPGNRLEALRGVRKGQHSIRINDRYRVCFIWRDRDAYDVEITDYH